MSGSFDRFDLRLQVIMRQDPLLPPSHKFAPKGLFQFLKYDPSTSQPQHYVLGVVGFVGVLGVLGICYTCICTYVYTNVYIHV